MKRRSTIIGAISLFVYGALLVVTWMIGTQQAAEKTDAQLDYAILDFRSTIGGAIDTMLGYVAKSAVRHIGKAERRTIEDMANIARTLDIDEVNVVNRAGVILASNDPHCLGVVMAGDPVMEPFMALTNGVTASVSQPFRPHARNPKVRAKYLAVAFPGGDGFVQVGLDERHLAAMLPAILGYIFDEWLLGRTGFFLCADASTDKLISNPSRHRNEAATLSDAGFDEEAARPFEIVSNIEPGKTFRQKLFGEKCYCRNYLFGGHRFVPALPAREYYDTRTVFVSVLAVLLFIVLAAFAWFVDRIFRDSDRLAAFYAVEDERRAKDMEIAKTIQNSALPNAFPESQCFRLCAAMLPAKDVGGDFYDYFTLDANHYAFLVADVSGKGITAALYMMTAKTLIKDMLLAVHDPALALTRANKELCANNPANMFLTAWVGVLDLETGIVTFANAGHNPPVRIVGKDGGKSMDAEFRTDSINDKSGPMLAFMDGIEYKPHQIPLGIGEALFLYTDGVTEATDEKMELFGEERLEETLRVMPNSEPTMICNVVRAAVAAFAAGAPQADDITVLAIRRIAAPRTFSRSFPVTIAAMADAKDYLDEKLAANDCPPAIRSVLDIILDEIASNIVRHSGASSFEIGMEFVDSPAGVKLSFVDDGTAYDPLAHVDPDITLSAEERPIGGLGILMVKKMSDAIAYNRLNNHNYLVVTKNFGR